VRKPKREYFDLKDRSKMGYSHPREEEEELGDETSQESPPLKMRRIESPVKEVLEHSGTKRLDVAKDEFKNAPFTPSILKSDVKHELKTELSSDLNENNDEVVKNGDFKAINGIKNESDVNIVKNEVGFGVFENETNGTETKVESDSDDDSVIGAKKNNTSGIRSDSEDEEEEVPIVYESTKDILGDIPIDDADKNIWSPMTFRPTYEEFKDLQKYVSYMESCGAHKHGIAKIIPPKEWVPRKQGYNPADIDIEIDHPVQQNISVTDVDGAFKTISDRSIPHFTVDKYMRLATNEKYITPAHNSYEELEELYWTQNLDDKLAAPIYGADVCDSITDPEETVWNIKRLDSLLTDVMEEQIPGVNMPYLYFGMWKATFSWHVEDMDLYGVNLLHYGAPKTWYCIPPQEGYKLEQVAQKLFPDMTTACYNLMRHKAIMISPKLLEANGVRVNKMIQEERNMIIVFPHAYHSGFNHGFNMAESTNFALPRWVEYGKRFRDCLCRGRDDEVSFELEPFIKKCQPERFSDWKKGLDWALHPEDPWYIKRCLMDAKQRLSREEISESEFRSLKREIKRKREIPAWFKDRFELDYCDDIKFLDVDLTDCIEVLERTGEMTSPRLKSAKRKLIEKIEDGKTNMKLKIKKLRSATANIYLSEMQAYNEMRAEVEREEKERKDRVAKGGADGLGSGAARGVGFVGADLQDLLEKKARTICKAKKNHRFKACAKCTGCRRENCGDCEYCLDMPKFGGMGVIKQKCQGRVCVNPSITTCDQCVWII